MHFKLTIGFIVFGIVAWLTGNFVKGVISGFAVAFVLFLLEMSRDLTGLFEFTGLIRKRKETPEEWKKKRHTVKFLDGKTGEYILGRGFIRQGEEDLPPPLEEPPPPPPEDAVQGSKGGSA